MKKILLVLIATLAFSSCKEDDVLVPEPLFIGEKEIVFELEGDQREFDIISNSPVIMDFKEVDWCTVKREGMKLVVAAEANKGFVERTTEFQFTNDIRTITVPVRQKCYPTAQVKVVHATADSEQSGENIELSYDGKPATFYHAKYGDSRPGGEFELVYYLEKPVALGMFIYTPRPGGGNGTFGKITVLVSTSAGEGDFVKVMDYDCAKTKVPVSIGLPSVMQDVNAVKILVDGSTSVGGFASCAEMEFYAVI